MTSRFVLDASVLLAGADSDDDQHAAAVRVLTSDDIVGTLDLAFYEVANVAVRAWRDPSTAALLVRQVAALADDGGLVRIDSALIAEAVGIATQHGISVYDAAYVAAARRRGADLVSCDRRDLVSKGLARLPAAVSPPEVPTVEP